MMLTMKFVPVLFFVFLMVPTVHAATSTSLGAAATFGVLSSSFTRNGGVTSIIGDLGYTSLGGSGSHTVTSGATFTPSTPQAGTDQGTALIGLNNQACDFNFGSTTDLSLLSQPLLPGVYCIAADASIGTGGITLSGAGTFIFQISGAFTPVASSHVTLINSANACDVFWTATQATTLGANATFSGTVIDDAGITVGASTTWTGRALAFGGTIVTDTNTITVPTCSVSPATITVLKTVINNNGGSKVVSNFSLFVNGAAINSGVTTTFAAPATYTVSETADSQYTTTFSGGCNSSGQVSIIPGDASVCNITNDDKPATLIITKHVVNDNGGIKTASDFTLNVTGTAATPSSFVGSEAGVTVTLNAGSYSVNEVLIAGYSRTLSADCSGTINNGETKTCTITNNDIQPTLTVTKVVSNTHGRTNVVSDFLLNVSSTPVTSGVTYGMNAGNYHVGETNQTGYSAIYSVDCDLDGNITLSVGDAKQCTITNSDSTIPTTSPPLTPPLMNVRKIPSPLSLPTGSGSVTYAYTVTNPGQIPITNVTLTDDKCSNMTFVSGDTNDNSQLDITETWKYRCTTTLTATTINYVTARGLANGMAAVDTASAEVVVGASVVPPLIHIQKTPSPLTLPANGGSVTYGYTVTNPGTVVLTDVTVTDNTCKNVTRVSGDTNGDSKLQVSETWKYTCTANMSQSTINTAIATGHANGLTAIDTALVTVIVAGSPIPPLIHIIKKADPIILPADGGWVTYTYAVTNPGTVSLNQVTVTDDKCTDVTVVSGDANGNGLLETDETWTYTCRKFLASTTTNSAIATGHGNGLTVTDVAVANVVLSPMLAAVTVPILPNTGFAPTDRTTMGVVSIATIFGATTLFFVVRKRKR